MPDAYVAPADTPATEPARPFSMPWDGRHIVVRPGDKMVVNLGPGVDRATVEAVRDDIVTHWPDIADDLMVISAETVTVIEA